MSSSSSTQSDIAQLTVVTFELVRMLRSLIDILDDLNQDPKGLDLMDANEKLHLLRKEVAEKVEQVLIPGLGCINKTL